MTDNFLPEFGHMKVIGGYRALYRLFDGQSFRTVCDHTRTPVVYKDVIEATKAAKEVVKRKLNPHLHCANDAKPDPVDDADLLGVEEWRKTQVEQYAASRAMVRNGKSHRTVVVERKKKRRV